MTRTRWTLVLGSIASLVGAAIACSSSGSTGASGGPGAADSGAGFDATTDVIEEPAVDQSAPETGAEETGPSDAGPDGPPSCTLDSGATGIVCGAAGCVDPTKDPMNCGGCGSAGFGCEAGSLCAMSHCQNVAGSLEGLRWQLPCTAPNTSTACDTVIDGSDIQMVTTTLSGTSEQTYLVTLHFRGVVEQKTYVGDDAGRAEAGEADGASNSQFFVAGGADNGDTFNIYELDVSDPPQTYFLNSGMSNINNVFWLDYVATIAMNAGASVTLTANAVDSQEILNTNGVDGGPVLVPGVPPYPQPYDGQFIQMDVLSVVPQ